MIARCGKLLAPKLAFDDVETRWAETPREAIEYIEQNAPDCVIFVWASGDGRVREAAEPLRRTCEARGVPSHRVTPGEVGHKLEAVLKRFTQGHPVKHVQSEERAGRSGGALSPTGGSCRSRSRRA